MRFLLALFNFDCDAPFFEAEYCFFAVAEGWLLLDIGWFVLLLSILFVFEVFFVANKTYIYCGSNDM